MFPPETRAEAADLLLHQCGNNLPFHEKSDEFKLERVRFAALKLSGGEIERPKEAIKLAKNDRRDLIVAVGFGGLDAHRQWFPSSREENLQ